MSSCNDIEYSLNEVIYTHIYALIRHLRLLSLKLELTCQDNMNTSLKMCNVILEVVSLLVMSY